MEPQTLEMAARNGRFIGRSRFRGFVQLIFLGNCGKERALGWLAVGFADSLAEKNRRRDITASRRLLTKSFINLFLYAQAGVRLPLRGLYAS